MRHHAASLLARASLPILTRLDPELAHDLGLAGLRWLRPLWPAFQAPADLVDGFGNLCRRASLCTLVQQIRRKRGHAGKIPGIALSSATMFADGCVSSSFNCPPFSKNRTMAFRFSPSK